MRSRPGEAVELGASTVLDSWRRQRWPMRILRGFLGVTFLYAGIQKLSDPNFLHSGTPDYIGAQLQAFARGSPIGPLLGFAGHFAVLAGVMVALVELGVGMGTLTGIAPKTTAGAGLVINLVLFLSATWHVNPYFLGSDSAYAVAWGAYLVGLIETERRASRAAPTRTRRSRAAAAALDEEMSRRRFLRGAAVGTAALAVGAFAFAVEGREAVVADPLPGPSATPSLPATTGHHPRSSPSVEGTPIASLDSLPVGTAKNFNDPSGEPSVLVRVGQNRVAAFSRVCTHAGCLVDFDPQAGLLVCPCHGAEFDPLHGAVPVAGPAPTALQKISVAIDPGTGEVVATG
jgi:thiosulfate dehydrogenase (quinone) large subunit